MPEYSTGTMRLAHYAAILTLQLVSLNLCLAFDLEGSQTSYAAFSQWNPCLNGSVSFEFKTDQPNGLLMYTDDGGKYDFFEVKLVGGIVRLRLNLGDGTVILTAGHDLNDMKWHKVEVKRLNQQTTILVDGVSQTRSSKGSEFAFGTVDKNSNVYFGGMPIEYSALLSTLALPSVMFEPRLRGSIRNIFYSNCGNPGERPIMVDFQGIRNSDEDQCDQNNHPCQHGGICVSRDNGAQCDCSRTDYEGELCHTAKVPSEATFFGTHYLTYDLSSRGDPIVSSVDKISLHFKTRQANGLLFYTGDGADYLNIALRNGEIAVSMNLGSGIYSSSVQPIRHRRFDDNVWHHLEVQRKAREIEIYVDDTKEDYGSASGDFTLLSSNILYVAGSPNTAHLPGSLVPNNFKGCMKKVEYKADGLLLDILDLARTEHDLIGIVGDVSFDKCHDLVESQPITFTSPESYISLPKWQVEKNGSISFHFQTIESDGVIMYNTNGGQGTSDFFALEILDGNLYLVLDLGSGPVKVKAPSRSLTDGLPHSVHVTLDGQNGVFEVDGNRIDFVTPGPDDRLNLDGNLYVGGISSHKDAYLLPPDMWAGMLGFGFVGCLQDLMINEEKIGLAQVAKEQGTQGIAEYCRSMDPQCLSRPCMHKGVCHEGWNRFICDCRSSGYIGPVCQEASTTLKFDGSQHMKVSLPEESMTEAEDISLRFKTIYPNGLLFVTTTRKSEDSMELSVSGGSIRFSLRLGESETSVNVGSDVNDGHWHTVYIKRRGREMEVRMDNHRPQRENIQADDFMFEYTDIILGSTTVTVDATAKSRRHSPYLNFDSLEVGNMMLSDDNSLRAPTSFNGEMQQFLFNNNEFIELASTGQIQNIELTATVNSQEMIKDPVTFKSKSAYVMMPQFQAYSAFTLYFQFKTTESEGLIFYNAGKEQDFIAVELSGGYLFYSFSVGAGSSRVKIESVSKVNDNEWHDVSIIRPDHSQHILRVDNSPATVHKAREMQIVHFDLTGPLFVGGVKKTMYSFLPRSVTSRQGYQGCLASLDVNNQMINLMSSKDRVIGSVAEGCQGPTVLCEQDSCVNNGRCVQQWNSFSCNCDLTSYTGPRCTEESISYRFGPGEGIITYTYPDGKHPKTTYDELALGFLTHEMDAILLRIDSGSSEDYIEMELVQGNIFVVYNMGNEDHPIAELFAKVSDGKYHVVRFVRTGPNSTIQVDNMQIQPKNPKGRQLNMFNDQALIQIGGKKNKDGRVERPFQGLMSGLVFNGQRLLDLADQGNPQISIEGAVQKDADLGAKLVVEPKPNERVEDLVKSGWQSTEGLRTDWATVIPKRRQNTEEYSGFYDIDQRKQNSEDSFDFSGDESGSYSGSGSGIDSAINELNVKSPNRFTKSPSNDISRQKFHQSRRKSLPPGFDDMENTEDDVTQAQVDDTFRSRVKNDFNNFLDKFHINEKFHRFNEIQKNKDKEMSVLKLNRKYKAEKPQTMFTLKSKPGNHGNNVKQKTTSDDSSQLFKKFLKVYGTSGNEKGQEEVSESATSPPSPNHLLCNLIDKFLTDFHSSEEKVKLHQQNSDNHNLKKEKESNARTQTSIKKPQNVFKLFAKFLEVYHSYSKAEGEKNLTEPEHGSGLTSITSHHVTTTTVPNVDGLFNHFLKAYHSYSKPVSKESEHSSSMENSSESNAEENRYTTGRLLDLSGVKIGKRVDTVVSLNEYGRKHTTPRQDVTDEIIFAGEGSGCDDDDNDDCTDVVSGHEDDIITPTVIIRTTPKPKTTTTTPSKHSPCDDEDSCDGSGTDGKETQQTKKPPTKKPPKKKRPFSKGSTKGTTNGPPSKETTVFNGVITNITIPLNGHPGENVNGVTSPPMKSETQDDLNLGLIIGIVAGVLVALAILIYALYKFRSREEGTYKVDETQNFAYINEPKKPLSTNGGLKPNNNCPPTKTGKKRDVKEWYV